MAEDPNLFYEQIKLWIADGVSKKDLFDRLAILLDEKRVYDKALIQKLQGFAAKRWHQAELESKLKGSEELSTKERIDAAFYALEQQHILARQNFACCSSCGHSEALGDVLYQREKGRPTKGYAFYHQQDTEHAMEGHGLYIGFGAFNRDEAEDRKIASEICETFVRYQIEHEWEGSARSRIFIKPFTWYKQKSSGGVLLPADKPWSVLGHPDGRIWAGRIENGQLEVRVRDNEGDVSTKKPRAREPHQELRRLIDGLLSDGFVMLHRKDLPALPD